MSILPALNPRTELYARKACLKASKLLLLAAGSAVLAYMIATVLSEPFLRTMAIAFLAMLAAGFAIRFVIWSMSSSNKDRIHELEQNLSSNRSLPSQ